MKGESELRSDPVAAAPSSRAGKPAVAKAGTGKSARSGAPGDVGQLLRGAYRQTVDEAIPDDLMDLLNKLE